MVYDQSKHIFSGNFDKNRYCIKSSSGLGQDACCTSASGHALSYNSASHDCCDDGEPKKIGTC